MKKTFSHSSPLTSKTIAKHCRFIVPDDQWNNLREGPAGAVVGARTAKRFGWKVGDRIPIKNTLYGPQDVEFNLDGIYRTEKADGDESQFWFHWKHFDENVPAAVKSTAGWYILKLDSPDDAVRVAKTIDMKFANSTSETKTETESAFAAGFAKQFGNIEFLILTIGSVVFFTLLLVTGNTMAISVRERTSELAVLKAIGVTDRSVLFLVLVESVVIALFGGLLGLLLAWAAIPVISVALNGLLPPLLLSKTMLSVGLVFAVLVGVASGLVSGIGAMRMSVLSTRCGRFDMAIPLSTTFAASRRWTSISLLSPELLEPVSLCRDALTRARFPGHARRVRFKDNALIFAPGYLGNVQWGALDSVRSFRTPRNFARH
jgi:putative ABC transport system permease protein